MVPSDEQYATALVSRAIDGHHRSDGERRDLTVSRVVAVLRVLLTNDDGIDAEGLQTLRRALVALDDIQLAVIAPDDNQSATARSITFRRPLWVTEVPFDDGTVGYACDGTPVDCVRLASLGLIDDFEPDLIVSGHQPRREPGRRHHLLGHGRGRAGGRRARHPGHRGLAAVGPARDATSGSGTPSTSSSAAAFTARVVDRLDDVPLPAGTLLNVNVPAGEVARRRGRAAGQADLPGPARPDRGGHRPQALPRLRRHADPRRRARHRPRGGRRRAGSRSPRCTST